MSRICRTSKKTRSTELMPGIRVNVEEFFNKKTHLLQSNMLSTRIITVELESGKYELFISPLLLQAKEYPKLKSGKIEVLHLYNLIRDDDYMMRLEQENLDEKLKSDAYIINCGQDYEKYYIGSLRIDFEAKRCWQWEAKPDKFSKQDIAALNDALFDPQTPSRVVTMFTPTRASDINLGRL